MNISQKKEIEVKGDHLVAMFDKQSQAEKEFGIIEGFPERLIFGKLENLHHPDVCQHINNNVLWRMTQEIHEAVIALRNAKKWRQTKYLTDVNEYLDEVADIMIYFINLCLASGIDYEMLTQIVLKKIDVNIDRIRSKY